MTVGIIVPVLNDAAALAVLLTDLRAKFGDTEIVVVDGRSGDDAEAVSLANGAAFVSADPGRGVQLNAGAAIAKSETLWFVHADASVHRESLKQIRETLLDPEIVGGAFRFSLVGNHWYKPLLELGVAIRSRLFHLPYGDQAYFVRRHVFEEMSGFPAYPIMEDFEFYRRLKKRGRTIVLGLPVGVSDRRWVREGYLAATGRNLALAMAYTLGVSPKRLAKWYRPAQPSKVSSDLTRQAESGC